MRNIAIAALAISTFGLSACGSEVEEPVEQIVVAEPGEVAGFPEPDKTPEGTSEPDATEQASE